MHVKRIARVCVLVCLASVPFFALGMLAIVGRCYLLME